MVEQTYGTDLVVLRREVVEPRQVSLPRAAAVYLMSKRKRLTPASERGYKSVLDAFAAAHSDLVLSDLEPPLGTNLIEDFLTERWSARAPRTYNKSHSILHEFVKWHYARGSLNRDPMLTLERAKPRPFHRTTFDGDQRVRIFATNPEPHDQVALHLLLDYGIRKGALRGVRFEHFDAHAAQLVVFTKGEKIHEIEIPDPLIWDLLETIAEPPEHYLLPRQVMRRRRPAQRAQLTLASDLLAQLQETVAGITDDACQQELDIAAGAAAESARWVALAINAASSQTRRYPDEVIGEHGLHDWWYRCLQRAGIVEEHVTHGQRMHKARHTAGQRVLDTTGNLKAAQTLLGHSTIGTTGDNYTGWENSQMRATMRDVLGLDDDLLRRAAETERPRR